MASAHGTAMAARLQAIQPTPAARARDWAEIQERTLVPLYDAVHQRLTVGQGVSLLDLGCRSGLALLLAAGRGRGWPVWSPIRNCASWPGRAGCG